MPDGAPAGPPCILVQGGAPPGEDRFWIWRDHVAPLWDAAVADSDEARRFQASAEVFHLGTGIVSRSAASGHLLRRTSTIVARMGVDHIVMELRRQGTQTGQASGRTVTAAPGDICFLDLARIYAAVSTDYEAIALAMPRDLFSPFLTSLDPLHGLVLRGDTPLGRLLAAHLVRLLDAAPGFSAVEASAAASGTAALAAASCGPAVVGSTGLSAAAAPATLLAIRHHIESNLGASDLSADRIAMRFGLSRSALYRLFEPLGGVADYVRKRRLARAYSELVRSASAKVRLRMTDLAGDCGFESGAVFSRAFRREYGFAPREMQFAARNPMPRPDEGSQGAALHDWLARLTR